MLQRYIVDKKALNILDLQVVDACETLSGEVPITDEHLHYSHLPFVSLMLNIEQVTKLKLSGLDPRIEKSSESRVTLATDYEKTRTSFYKVSKKGLTGRGVKVGHLDSGVASAVVPVEFANNFVGSSITSEDEFGHGTETASIIKHPTMGLASGCTFHNIKMIDVSGGADETWVLAALNYVLANNLDIINLSWTFDSSAMRVALATIQANNTVVVAAAGNAGVDSFTLIPATLPGVVAVNSIASNQVPFDKNIYPNPTIINSHGIDVACNGVGCEVYTKTGVHGATSGTSFACPFFVGVFTIYKEEFQEANNYKVLQQVYDKIQKSTNSLYYGRGILAC